MAMGVTAGAVRQWLKRARTGGRAALCSHPPPGPPPTLRRAQRAALPAVHGKGGEASGFLGDVWTTTCSAVVITRVVGVREQPAHSARLLRQRGWTVPTPIQRAIGFEPTDLFPCRAAGAGRREPCCAPRTRLCGLIRNFSRTP